MENKMKKLKLYGKKDGFEGFIAEIYVDNNKVVVESKDEEVKKELLNEINKVIQKGESFLLPYPHETETSICDGFLLQKVGDPKFIEALHSEFWKVIGLGEAGKFGNKTFGGYKIIAHKSLIIEE